MVSVSDDHVVYNRPYCAVETVKECNSFKVLAVM